MCGTCANRFLVVYHSCPFSESRGGLVDDFAPSAYAHTWVSQGNPQGNPHRTEDTLRSWHCHCPHWGQHTTGAVQTNSTWLLFEPGKYSLGIEKMGIILPFISIYWMENKTPWRKKNTNQIHVDCVRLVHVRNNSLVHRTSDAMLWTIFSSGW